LSDFSPGDPHTSKSPYPDQPPTVGDNQDRPVFGYPPQTPTDEPEPAPDVSDPPLSTTRPPEVSASDTGSSGGGSGKLAWLAAMVGVVALVGGGAFFAVQAFGASGGAATPDEAVTEMIAAINGEDVITIGELLEPGERRTIVEPVLTDILPELQRLGVFDESLDAADVEGVDIELTDVTWRIEPIGDSTDLKAVYFTGGNASSEVVAAQLPWGDDIRDVLGGDIEDAQVDEPIEDSGDAFVLIERNGRWYFSMWHSIAESGRVALGEPLPAASEAPAALGADTPADAVEQMIQAMVAADVRQIIGHLDPEEAAALYRYSPLFLDDLEARANQDLGDVDVTVTDLTFDTSTDGDDAEVRITSFTVNVTFPDGFFEVSWQPARASAEGEISSDDITGAGAVEISGRQVNVDLLIDQETVNVTGSISPSADSAEFSGTVSGEPVNGQISFTEPCRPYEVTFGDEVESGCLDPDEDEADVDVAQLINDALGQWEEGLSGISVTAHRTDGKWYVSPTLSTMDFISRSLAEVSREDFNKQISNYQAAADGLTLDDFAGPVESIAGGGDNPDVVEALPTPPPFPTPPPSSTPEPFDADEPAWVEVERGDIVVTEPGVVSAYNQLGDFTADIYGIVLDLDPEVVGPDDIADVTISVLSGEDVAPDPLITLLDANFSYLDQNDDAPADANLPNEIDSQITIGAAEADFYLIVVESYDGMGGDYDLEVSVTVR